MRILLIAVATIIVCAGVLTWALDDRRVLTDSARQAANVLETQTHFEASGTLLRYEGSGVRAWYLLYVDAGGDYIRKELRFSHERGCTPQAGDLPCVTHDEGEVVSHAPGSYIRIKGEKGGQRILVDAVRVLETPEEFRPITLSAGESYVATMYTLTLERVYRSDDCELYLGCFDPSIPRVAFSYRGGRDEGKKTLVPGMLIDTTIGKVVVVSGNPEASTASLIVLPD